MTQLSSATPVGDVPYCHLCGQYVYVTPHLCTRQFLSTPAPRGCICPPGSEKTCKGWDCPRRGVEQIT